MLLETITLAFRTIRRNALRSLLTILGIVIGVAAVIAMVTLGSGTTAKVVADISSLGSNLLAVRPGQGPGPGGPGADAKAFNIGDATAIAAEIAGVKSVAPAASKRITAIVGNENWATTLTGTDDGYFETRQWELAGGRTFTDSELRAGSAVCLIGETVRKNLFGAGDPLGQTVRLQKISCTIIGLLATKGQAGFGQDQDDVVLMPLRAFQRRFAGNSDVDVIYASARDGASTAKVKARHRGIDARATPHRRGRRRTTSTSST